MSQVQAIVKAFEEIDPELKPIIDTFIYFIDGMEGRRASDIRSRVELFTNPRNPLTATNLSPQMVDVVVSCMIDGTIFYELSPMKEWALEMCLGMLSKEGFAINTAKESMQVKKDTEGGPIQIVQGALDKMRGKEKE